MILKPMFLNLNILLIFISSLYECKKIYSNYTEEFINLAVISDSVYIGGKHSLIQLNSPLEIVNIKPMEGSNWLLTPYKPTDKETILMSCDYRGEYESECTGYRSDLSIVDGYQRVDINIKKPHARYTTTTIGSDNILIIASSDCLKHYIGSDECVAISKYREQFMHFNYKGTYTVKYVSAKGNNRFSFDFKAVVGNGKYTYFFFVYNHTVSKLGKICKDINIFTGNNNPNAYEDVPIVCSHKGIDFTTAQDLIFWNDNLLAVFTDGTASVICKFTKLADNFEISRIDRLKCPFTPLKNKYFKNPSFPVCYNETVMKCQSLTRREIDCPEMTNGFCNPQFFSSVEGDVPMIGDVIYYSQNSAVGSIVKMTDAIIVDEFVILYVGTSKGLIGKIFINDTDAFSLGDFKIVQWLSPVIDIKRNGEHTYAMTKHVIASVSDIEDCRTSSNCEDCMQSKNPICGWDIITQSCNKNFDKPFWVPSAGQKCLTIKSSGIALHNNDDTSRDAVISFQLTPAIYLSELKYVIQINSSPETRPKDVQKMNDNFKTDKVNVSYGDTFLLRVTDSNGTTIASTQVALYKCGAATNCTSCVHNRECYWCPLKAGCYLNSDSCNGQINPKEESMCPRIDNSKDLLITYGTTTNLSMKTTNFDIYDNTRNMICAINSMRYDAIVLSDTAVCQNVIAPNTMNKNYDVYLLYNDTRLDGSANLKVYRCQNLENVDGNCGHCKYWKGQGYDCDWCNNRCKSTVSGSCSSERCNVEVSKVFPASGPESGGTKITIYGQNIGNPNDNITVKIYGVECTNIEVLRPSSVISCMSGNFNQNLSSDLTISINEHNTIFPANQYYNFETPMGILNFTPNRSIIAGGRKIRITGHNMFFGSNGHMYDVKFCTDNNGICIQCRDAKPAGMKTITCRMGKSNGILTLTKLIVTVDNNTPLNYTGMFNVVNNPTIHLSPKHATVFRSGGINITIKGKSFLDVGEIRLNNMENSCIISTDTIVVCETPPYVSSDFERRKRSTGQNIHINYDDFQAMTTIYYTDNPVFEKLSLIEYDKESTIVIKGRNLLTGAKREEYVVEIGLDGKCFVREMTNENITCLPPKEVPRTNHSDENVVAIMVNVGRIREHIGYLKYISKIPITTILIAVLSTAFVAAIIIGLSAVLIIRHKKNKAVEGFQMKQIKLAETIREASIEDAQMTIRKIKAELVTCVVPYFDYQSYAFHQLFPNQEMETHPLLYEPMITDDKKSRAQKAMTTFDKLMTNKLFLKSLVQTLEHQSRLTMNDKENLASLLSVAVLGNMRLFYELISCLLSDMIQSSPQKQHKALFKGFETITERLIVNWLEMSMYHHLKSGSGMKLFMLYKATQAVIEKAPIDAVTESSRNTLAEERLLKNRVEYETMTLNIDMNGNSDEKIPVSVLDCDTITQVKQKCITAIYKTKPASEIPTPHELVLEWQKGKSEKVKLEDIDKISYRINGMVRLNMLKWYMVKNGSNMTLVFQESQNDSNKIYENHNVQNDLLINPCHVNLEIQEKQYINKWHLTKLTEDESLGKEQESDELFLNRLFHTKTKLTEDESSGKEQESDALFLNRLFHTKLILRDYIDTAFEGMMDASSLPVPVRYFLCMLDKLGKGIGVDNDVLQAWKSECYATQLWAPLISRPEILFDVDVPSHVEPCMDILRQVLIDSFSQGIQNGSQESSTQKLLFYKDVAGYRKSVNLFFMKVEMVDDQEFWRAMDDMSTVQTKEMKFNRQATLHQLFGFISKYKEEIIKDFADKDETNFLEFAKILQEVVDLMQFETCA